MLLHTWQQNLLTLENQYDVCSTADVMCLSTQLLLLQELPILLLLQELPILLLLQELPITL